MLKRHFIYMLCMSAMSIAALWGCGAASELTGSSNTKAERRGKPQEVGGLNLVGSGHAKGRSFCASARALRGPTAEDITFTAKCVGLVKGGPIDLVIVRHPLRNSSKRSKLVAYGKPLKVVGANAANGHGSCTLKENALECGVRAKGHIVIMGRVRVPSTTQCDSQVSIVNITVAACANGVCEGSPLLHELFRGKPNGCA